MKKFFYIFLSLILILGLTACGKDKNPEGGNEPDINNPDPDINPDPDKPNPDKPDPKPDLPELINPKPEDFNGTGIYMIYDVGNVEVNIQEHSIKMDVRPMAEIFDSKMIDVEDGRPVLLSDPNDLNSEVERVELKEGLNLIYYYIETYKKSTPEIWTLKVNKPAIEKTERIVISNWNELYSLNDKFIDGSITVIEENPYYGVISQTSYPITLDMVENFSTSKGGTFDTKVTFRNNTYNVTYSVIVHDTVVPQVPSKPVTTLSMDKVKEFCGTLGAGMGSFSASGTKYDEIYKKIINSDMMDYCKALLEASGAKEEELTKAINIAKTKMLPEIQKIAGSDHQVDFKDTIKFFENAPKAAIKEFIESLNAETLLSVCLVHFFGYYSPDLYGMDGVAAVYYDFDQLLKDLAPNLTKEEVDLFKKNYNDSINALSIINMIKKNDMRYLASVLKETLIAVCNLTLQDAKDIKAMKDVIYKAGEYLETPSNEYFVNNLDAIKKGILALGKVKTTLTKEKYQASISVIYDNVFFYGTNSNIVSLANKNNNYALYNVYDFFTTVMTKFTDQNIADMANILTKYYKNEMIGKVPASEIHFFAQVADIVDPEFNKLNEIDKVQLYSAIAELLKPYFPIKAQHVKSIFELLAFLETQDANNLTDKQISYVRENISSIFNDTRYENNEYHYIGSDIVLDANASKKELYDALPNSFQVYSSYNSDYILKEDVEVLAAEFTEGIHEGILKANSITFKVPYYVAPASFEEGRFILANGSDGSTGLNVVVWKDQSKRLHDFNNPIEYCEIHLLDTKINTIIGVRISLPEDLNELKGFDSKVAGNHIALYNYNHQVFGNYLVPVDYFVYDGTDQVTGMRIQDKEVTIVQGTQNTQLTYFLIEKNNGLQITNEGYYSDTNYEHIMVNTKDIKNLDVNKVGIQDVIYTYEGVQFKFKVNVISKEEYYRITEFNFHYDSSMSDTFDTDFLEIDFANLDGYQNMRYNEFMEFIKGTNIRLSFSIQPGTKLELGEHELTLTLSQPGVEDLQQTLYFTQEEVKPVQIYSIKFFNKEGYNDFIFKTTPNVDELLQQIGTVEVYYENGFEECLNSDEFNKKFNPKFEFMEKENLCIVTVNEFKTEIYFMIRANNTKFTIHHDELKFATVPNEEMFYQKVFEVIVVDDDYNDVMAIDEFRAKSTYNVVNNHIEITYHGLKDVSVNYDFIIIETNKLTIEFNTNNLEFIGEPNPMDICDLISYCSYIDELGEEFYASWDIYNFLREKRIMIRVDKEQKIITFTKQHDELYRISYTSRPMEIKDITNIEFRVDFKNNDTYFARPTLDQVCLLVTELSFSLNNYQNYRMIGQEKDEFIKKYGSVGVSNINPLLVFYINDTSYSCRLPGVLIELDRVTCIKARYEEIQYLPIEYKDKFTAQQYLYMISEILEVYYDNSFAFNIGLSRQYGNEFDNALTYLRSVPTEDGLGLNFYLKDIKLSTTIYFKKVISHNFELKCDTLKISTIYEGFNVKSMFHEKSDLHFEGHIEYEGIVDNYTTINFDYSLFRDLTINETTFKPGLNDITCNMHGLNAHCQINLIPEAEKNNIKEIVMYSHPMPYEMEITPSFIMYSIENFSYVTKMNESFSLRDDEIENFLYSNHANIKIISDTRVDAAYRNIVFELSVLGCKAQGDFLMFDSDGKAVSDERAKADFYLSYVDNTLKAPTAERIYNAIEKTQGKLVVTGNVEGDNFNYELEGVYISRYLRQFTLDIKVEKEDYYGNSYIVSIMKNGQSIGEFGLQVFTEKF